MLVRLNDLPQGVSYLMHPTDLPKGEPRLTILNDLHLGVNRSAGTTPASRVALKDYMFEEFKRLLPDNDLMILGDLFDSFDVPLADLFKAYQILHKWLDKGHTLFLVAGNHDLSKTSTVLGSFKLLGELLRKQFNYKVVLITSPTLTHYGYVIPHLPNQTLFDEALKNVQKIPNLFLHCNYNNFFAAQSDQSLNLSALQADSLPVDNIFIAHEHQARCTGKVILPGNQIASSVSDWLNCKFKAYLTIDEENTWSLNSCATSSEMFLERDWKDLTLTDHKFIRVIGTASASEASQVVNAISTFRAASPAFVVSNAVRIEADGSQSGFAEALEAVQGFDVWQALAATLQPADMGVLKGLK